MMASGDNERAGAPYRDHDRRAAHFPARQLHSASGIDAQGVRLLPVSFGRISILSLSPYVLSERRDLHPACLAGVAKAERAGALGRGRPPQDRVGHAGPDAGDCGVPGFRRRERHAEHPGPDRRTRRRVPVVGDRIDGRRRVLPGLAQRTDHPSRDRQRDRAHPQRRDHCVASGRVRCIAGTGAAGGDLPQ